MMPKHWLLRIFLLLLIGTFSGVLGAFVGIDIRTNIPNFPPASNVVTLLKAHQITHVRLFNADAPMLRALANTSIEVMVGVTNKELLTIGNSTSEAAEWILKNVAEYVPDTNITAIAAGSEVLTSMPHSAHILVPAMQRLHLALVETHLDSQIKVSTPLPMDIILKPFPPSNATFNSPWNVTMHSLLHFLNNTNSFFMLNAFPYHAYTQGNDTFPLEYALFKPLPSDKQIVDPNTKYLYNSMFDAMVDSVYHSMSAYNFDGISVVVTETGWPRTGGDYKSYATVNNSDTYISNLIRRVHNNSGPPSQPNMPINTYIYELFNEDDDVHSPVSKYKWGLFDTRGVPVFSVSLGDPASDNSTVFCVVKEGADAQKLRNGLNWACGDAHADCSAIQEDQPCFYPDTLENHASFAYNDYYQRMHSVGGTCDFGGTATTTTKDPSYGSCVFTGSKKTTHREGFVPPTGLGPISSPVEGGSSGGDSSSSSILYPKIEGLIAAISLLWLCI